MDSALVSPIILSATWERSVRCARASYLTAQGFLSMLALACVVVRARKGNRSLSPAFFPDRKNQVQEKKKVLRVLPVYPGQGCEKSRFTGREGDLEKSDSKKGAVTD